MSTVAKKGGDGIIPVSEGLHPATCIWIVDLGDQLNKYYDTYQHKVLLTFEVHDENITIDGEEKPRVISSTYTLSLGEKANLRRDLESWAGKKFSEPELDGFDVKKVLKKHCQINVAHTEKNGKTYANIISIVPWPKGMDQPEIYNELVYYDMDDPKREEALVKLPEWMQKRVRESRSYDNIPLEPLDENEPLPF